MIRWAAIRQTLHTAAGRAAERAAPAVRRRLGWEDRWQDVDPTTRRLLDAVRPYTMTAPERLVALRSAVQHITAHSIPGAIVECGVWRGGSMMAAALTLVEAGDTDRDLYLFDTFEGMVAPTTADRRHDGAPATDLLAQAPRDDAAGIWCISTLDEVRTAMTRTGYPAERIHYVKGRVEDTIPDRAPARIALLRLDTDWYESTRHELVHLRPRVSPHGVLIVDDYGYWQGCRRAVDEYFASVATPVFLHRIDSSGRIAVLPPDPAVRER